MRRDGVEMVCRPDERGQWRGLSQVRLPDAEMGIRRAVEEDGRAGRGGEGLGRLRLIIGVGSEVGDIEWFVDGFHHGVVDG